LETTQKFYDTVSPFLYPVEDIIAAIPDYARLIKQPIDLLKIKARLEAGDYEDFQQVDADMRLMIRNAKTFNPPQEPVHQCAVQLATIWDEKLKSLPAKQEARDLSEDPLADDFIDDASDEEDGEWLASSLSAELTLAEQITKIERQIAGLQQQLVEIRARRAARKSRPKKSKKPVQRKQSLPKTSPGFGTNGHAKKPRKSRDIVYKDDDEAESEDDINGQITLAQKQELADKMGTADGDTLQKAITIIQQTQDLGSVSCKHPGLSVGCTDRRTMTRSSSISTRCLLARCSSCTTWWCAAARPADPRPARRRRAERRLAAPTVNS
jgi:bromodomain-containing factor 1